MFKINKLDVPKNAVAYKYADSIEGEKWLFDEYEAFEIFLEDPSLIIWIEKNIYGEILTNFGEKL